MIVYRPLSPIRAISFDLDDTLYNNMPIMHKAQRSLNKYIKKRYPIVATVKPNNWLEIRRDVLQEQPELVNDVGLLRATVLTKVFLFAGMPKDKVSKAVTHCYDHFYDKRSDFKVPKSVHKVLKKLAKRVPLAAITNGNVNCKAIGIDKYFTCIVHASTKQLMKPHQAMFDHVSSTLKIPSKNILHVGDDLVNDIKGACDAGYQSAWLAVNRPMHMSEEPVSVLPNVQLRKLKQLKKLVKKG